MKHRFLYIITLLLLCSCEGTTYRSSVPSYPVGMRINILAEYPHFQPTATGEYLIFDQPRYPTEAVGYAGLLIYVAMDAQYHAYDLACPRCLDRQQGITVDGFFAVCPICEERYDLSYGLAVPTKGIATEALRQYNALYSNGYLTITSK